MKQQWLRAYSRETAAKLFEEVYHREPALVIFNSDINRWIARRGGPGNWNNDN